MQKSVALHTLGCKLNFSETTTIGRILENDGFLKKDFKEVADIYVINTCSVTENADKECRQIVRRIQRSAPQALVVITGCYAQLKPKEIASIPGVDLVLGAAEKFNISHHLRSISKTIPTTIHSCEISEVNTFIPSHSLHERTRVFMKVQDGCDYNCSFCTIPLARGKSRSNSIDNILAQVEELASAGAREIILTGINLGDFGNSELRKSSTGFLSLISELDKISSVDRFRISSIEPNLLSTEIIDFVGSSKRFMAHFHIPLQSGSNKILAAMRRRYKRELYKEKIEYIKSKIPHCCIGVDVITGFPGENSLDFEETVNFITGLDISYLHVFTYSERENTQAINLPGKVPMGIRHERTKALRNISFNKMQEFTFTHIGTSRPVLFESKTKNGLIEGFTDNYIKVTTIFREELENNIVNWKI